MEKKVYCLIGERCKCIKYVPHSDISDVENIRRSLLHASKSDAVLNFMLKDKYIVFQKRNPDRDNKLCDIEDDEEIPDKSDITCVMISMPTSSSPILIDNLVNPDDVAKDESVEMNVKVLYTEPLATDNDPVVTSMVSFLHK